MRPILSVFAVLLACACGADTGGALVEAHVAIAAESHEDGPSPARFVTETGWDVELDEALLAVQSILVYAPSERSLSLSRLLMGRALAHGGYDPFTGRRVRLEHVGPAQIDLITPDVQALGSLEAEAGAMDSASLVFGDLTDHEGQAWVRGTARRGDEVVEFEGALRLEDEALLRRVDGVPAAGSIGPGGTLVFRVRPFRWFDEAHFDRLAPSTRGARQIDRTSQVHTAWLLASRSSATYATEWMDP